MLHFSNAPFKWWKSEDFKIHSWNVAKIEFFFNVFYYFKSNSNVKYCLSDEKVRISKNHSRFFVKIKFLCCLIIWIEFLCIKLFKWWKSDAFKNHYWNFVQRDFLCFLLFWIEFLCIEKVRISKIFLEILLKSNSYFFYYFKSNSYVLYCLSDEKVMISKIILEILCKWVSYVFFNFESNSYVLYCLSDEKVIISKIILEILLKSNSYVFFYFKSNSLVLGLYCLSDEKSENFKKSFLKFC